MNHVMLDLETFSTQSDAMIATIGAVEISAGKLGREFYVTVNSRGNHGHVDPATCRWWVGQEDPTARQAFAAESGDSLEDALAEFSRWLPQDPVLWGNGATFDNVILRNAYQRCGIRAPWSYSNDRCFRTLKNLVNVPVPARPANESAHHALSDARHQARHLIALLAAIGAK